MLRKPEEYKQVEGSIIIDKGMIRAETCEVVYEVNIDFAPLKMEETFFHSLNKIDKILMLNS